jgi:hypothetical protein
MKGKLDRPFDNPDLMPREWMLTVMRDPHVSLMTRIEVAAQLLKLDYESGTLFLDGHPNDREVKVTIVIQPLGNNAPELIEHESAEPKVQIPDLMSRIIH